MYFVVQCDIAPGAGSGLDKFLAGRLRDFWLAQPSVKGYRVYGNALDEGFSTVDPDAEVSKPRRILIIEVDELATLQHILDSDERKKLRRELITYLANIETQVQDQIV